MVFGQRGGYPAAPPYPDTSHARRLRANLHGGTGSRTGGPGARLQARGLRKPVRRTCLLGVASRATGRGARLRREGDKLIVTRLDRLARSMGDLLEIAERLRAKGVALQVLDPAMDTSTAAASGAL